MPEPLVGRTLLRLAGREASGAEQQENQQQHAASAPSLDAASPFPEEAPEKDASAAAVPSRHRYAAASCKSSTSAAEETSSGTRSTGASPQSRSRL